MTTRLQVAELVEDRRNVELLRLLRDDPRISTSELARQVGMSAPAVRERVLRLEEAGVIAGYKLELDATALGYPVCAYVRVRPAPGQLPKVAELARQLPQVVECHRVTGEDCFIARAYVKSITELERLIDQIIPYATTNTSIIQSSPVARRLPPIGPRR